MRVKTFQAKTTAEALQLVKAELGPDAMILGCKTLRRRGFLGLYSRTFCEVTAATELQKALRKTSYQEKEEQAVNTREEFQKSLMAPLAREVRELRERVAELARKGSEPLAKVEPVPAKLQEEARQTAYQELAPKSVDRQELAELKKMLLSAATGSARGEGALPVAAAEPKNALPTKALANSGAVPVANPPLAGFEAELQKRGLTGSTLQALLERVSAAVAQGATATELRRALEEVLAAEIKCSGPLRIKKGSPRIVALVGPTGVGKTTTIAKLAAVHALQKKVRVALVTIDNFRVGAVEQLKNYAMIMGVPLAVAATPEELERVLTSFRDKELILIDTPGRSPRDREQLAELKGFLETRFAIETHLCLAATTKDRELRETIERFGMLPVNRLLFTKLDESESFGCLVNMLMQHKLQVSYVTNGQRVPEDIAVATGKKLAAMILGGQTDECAEHGRRPGGHPAQNDRIVPWAPARASRQL